jgi:peroxiredoxin/predicted 2-oxoglutarate/Fe(II)-dependent dioxygenase YbiX
MRQRSGLGCDEERQPGRTGEPELTPALKYRPMPQLGEPAPWFHAATVDNHNFSFNTVAGRRVVLCFFGNMPPPQLQSFLHGMRAMLLHPGVPPCAFFGVGTAADQVQGEVFKNVFPEGYLFLDRNHAVSELYGVALADDRDAAVRVTSFVLDERLRVAGVIPWPGGRQHAAEIAAALRELADAPAEMHAPVLVVPRIFEPEFCRTLIRHYESRGGEVSGFMRDVEGRTTLIHDPKHKRRKDCVVDDEDLRIACMRRIRDRLVPEIEKAFQFKATRIERYIVACYDAGDAGHFRAHRDNTTRATAHRKFAVSMNLNAGDFDGGMLRFPEFGRRLYQPPLGGAVVFSCSLLHEATAVARGKRYAFLPFLYDESSQRIPL